MRSVGGSTGTRIPQVARDRVEVQRGSGSDVYGADALAAAAHARVGYSAGGEWFDFDGYIPVATEQDRGIAPRGPIDSLLGSTHLSGLASAEYQAANGWRVDVVGFVISTFQGDASLHGKRLPQVP